MTSRKKAALAGALVLVMAVSAIGGTLAYLTDSSHLDNVFLVGAFTQPTDPKPEPDPPGPGPNPPKPSDDDVGAPNGFIFEPYWNANGKDTYTNKETSASVVGDHHRLQAGGTTVKDPYIGIGKGSEKGYVLACITNPMADNVYFTLGEGWAPVTGHVTEVSITDDNGRPANVTDTNVKFYSQGLFKWVGTGHDSGSSLVALEPTATNDVWTAHPVFSYVYTAKNGLNGAAGNNGVLNMDADSRKMTVWAYIGQSEGQQQDGTTAITSQYVEDQAKAWATNDSDATKYPGITATS